MGDNGSDAGDLRQWSVAAERMFQIEVLRPFNQRYGANEFPAMAKDVVIWIRETASQHRQRGAIIGAQPHDWIRARRLVRFAIGPLDRADAASPKQHAKNRRLFTRLAVGWARLVFPILLAVARTPEQPRSATKALFAAQPSFGAAPECKVFCRSAIGCALFVLFGAKGEGDPSRKVPA